MEKYFEIKIYFSLDLHGRIKTVVRLLLIFTSELIASADDPGF